MILDVAFAADPASEASLWRDLDVPAVATGRMVVAKDAYLQAPSPRIAEALARLDAILYPPPAP